MGLHFETDGAWDAKAAVENTLILGESGELVIGGSASITGGVSIEILLLDLLEVFIGFRQVLSNDCKFNFSTEETEVKELQEKVTHELVEIATAAKIKAIEAEVEAAKNKVDVADTAWKACDGNYKLAVDKSKACVKKSYVTGAKDEVVAEVNKALATQKNTLGAKTKLVGEKTKAVADKTEILGSHVGTAADAINNVAAKTQLHTEQTALSSFFFTI
jgi:hypothetical protein